VTDIRQGQRAETTRHSTPEHAERALEGLAGESAAARKNRCTKPGDHETKGRAARERGAGQTENHTQQHKDRAKRDGWKRARPSVEQRAHAEHKKQEKRAFLIFSKITKKSAASLAPLSNARLSSHQCQNFGKTRKREETSEKLSPARYTLTVVARTIALQFRLQTAVSTERYVSLSWLCAVGVSLLLTLEHQTLPAAPVLSVDVVYIVCVFAVNTNAYQTHAAKLRCQAVAPTSRYASLSWLFSTSEPT
jgi:hypothetical protein